jgi:hypothetical protein
VNNLNKNVREENSFRRNWRQLIKKPFIPDDGKPNEFEIKMPTAEHIWLSGHVPSERCRPLLLTSSKVLTHRKLGDEAARWGVFWFTAYRF